MTGGLVEVTATQFSNSYVKMDGKGTESFVLKGLQVSGKAVRTKFIYRLKDWTFSKRGRHEFI